MAANHCGAAETLDEFRYGILIRRLQSDELRDRRLVREQRLDLRFAQLMKPTQCVGSRAGRSPII